MGRAGWVFAVLATCAGVALAEPDGTRRSGTADRAATTSAAAPAAVRAITFSGRQWNVKSSTGGLWGPGPNRFSDSDDNVWVDEQGRLHLKITYSGGVWHCAEVVAQSSLGYGSYRWTLASPVDALDAQVVLGLFTWNDDPAFNHRELDIEFARWGNPLEATNAQFVVQPYDGRDNLRRWTLQPGYLTTTHQLRWTQRSVDFYSSSAGNPLAQWSYTRRNGIPRPGGENARINLWLYQGLPPRNGQTVEVIVSRFEHLP